MKGLILCLWGTWLHKRYNRCSTSSMAVLALCLMVDSGGWVQYRWRWKEFLFSVGEWQWGHSLILGSSMVKSFSVELGYIDL